MTISKSVNQVAAQTLLFAIGAYQSSKSLFFPPTCRFYPSCSAYAADAVRKYGPARGSWKAFQRLCRCHPFHPGGYDPV